MKLKGNRRLATYKYLYVVDGEKMECVEGATEVRNKCKDVRKFVEDKLQKEYGDGVLVELDVVRTVLTFEVPYKIVEDYIVKEN